MEPKEKPIAASAEKKGEVQEDPMLQVQEDFTKKEMGKIAENGELDLFKVSKNKDLTFKGLKWTVYEFIDY